MIRRLVDADQQVLCADRCDQFGDVRSESDHAGDRPAESHRSVGVIDQGGGAALAAGENGQQRQRQNDRRPPLPG
jgi:hypothetical protein